MATNPQLNLERNQKFAGFQSGGGAPANPNYQPGVPVGWDMLTDPTDKPHPTGGPNPDVLPMPHTGTMGGLNPETAGITGGAGLTAGGMPPPPDPRTAGGAAANTNAQATGVPDGWTHLTDPTNQQRGIGTTDLSAGNQNPSDVLLAGSGQPGVGLPPTGQPAVAVAGTGTTDGTPTEGQPGYRRHDADPHTGQLDPTIDPASQREGWTNPFTPSDAPQNAPQWDGFSMSELEKDPGYQFRLAEGEKAIKRQAAARGMLNSGATLKALERYRGQLASEEFQRARQRKLEDYGVRMGEFQYGQKRAIDNYQMALNDYNLGIAEEDRARQHSLQEYMLEAADSDDYFNRLMQLSGQGGGSTNNLIQVGMGLINGQANAIGQGANAQAAGIMGAANAGVMGQMAGNQVGQTGFQNILAGVGALGSIFQWVYG